VATVKSIAKGSEEDYMDSLIAKTGNRYNKIHKSFAKPNSTNVKFHGPGVELADLYSKSGSELYTMKLGGSTETTMYSLEQSILALSIVNSTNSYDISEIQKRLGNGNKMRVVLQSENNGLVWIYPIKNSDGKARFGSKITTEIQNESVDLSGLGSILVKVRLSEWAQCVNESHQQPVIHFVTPVDMSR
jgi:hypothetical protein